MDRTILPAASNERRDSVATRVPPALADVGPRPHRICLVYPHEASFIDADLRLLSEDFDVVPFEYGGKQHILRLFRTLRTCSLSLSWFVLGHAAAAVRLSHFLGKRAAIVVGGWDVAAMPEIGYGAMLGGSRRRKTRWTLRAADLVLAVSEASRREALAWTDREVAVVPLGVDVGFFTPDGTKEALVLTGASVLNETTFLTKGLDVFLDAARALPEVRFILFGRHSAEWEGRLRKMAPPNVLVQGWLDRSGVRALLRRGRVYAQLSAHESFGMTLAEAMACGCVPVVSDRGALPEVVDGTGHVVPYGDAEAASRAIQRALEVGPGDRARERVATAYSQERRRALLVDALRRLLP